MIIEGEKACRSCLRPAAIRMKFPNASPIAPAWKSLTPWGMSKSRWPSYLVLDKNSFSYCSLRTDAVHAVHALIGTRDQPTREQGYGCTAQTYRFRDRKSTRLNSSQ